MIEVDKVIATTIHPELFFLVDGGFNIVSLILSQIADIQL